MNELIKVQMNEQQEPTIRGRELHEFLEVKEKYTDWVKRMFEYGFIENQDFTVTLIFEPNSKGGKQSYVDHAMKIDMAKDV